MEQAQHPTLNRFFKAFMLNWLTKCSGGLSVPFAAAAAFAPNLSVRLLFVALAVIAFLTACYTIWNIERTSLIKAEQVCDGLTQKLDREQERRLKPEIYIGHHSLKTVQGNAALDITNKGITAVNIKFMPMMGIETSLQFTD